MLSRAEKAWLVAVLVLRHVMPLQIHTIDVNILFRFYGRHITAYMAQYISPSRETAVQLSSAESRSGCGDTCS